MDKIDKMNRTKLKLSDLNPHLMCVLCGGYYIDATTIVECLHSFCRSCIVKHLESSKYCPICEVQVHKTKPLVNIRPDKTLQDIVYKLVPGLYANEMRNRRKFYRERPHYMKPSDSESIGEVSEEGKAYINDENITLSLDYHRCSKHGSLEDSFQEIATPIKSEKRYFKCPTGVTIYHLQKLLKAKYDLNDSNYKVEIYFKDQPLHEEFTLLDISYIYLWKSKGTLDLTFKIYESIVKRQKIEEVKEEPVAEGATGRDVAGVKEEPTCKKEEEEAAAAAAVAVAVAKPESTPAESSAEVKASADGGQPREARAEETRTPTGAEGSSKSEAKPPPPPETVKQNGVAGGEESKEVQLQISESGVMSVSQIENGNVVRTVEESSPKLMDNFRNSSNTGGAPVKKEEEGESGKQERMRRLIPEQSKQPPKPVKPYKTIRSSPKSWNPVITKEKLRPTLMKNSDEPKKPLKFFKMRNMPRFLGNPASGVKPMYAESSEKEERRGDDRKDNAKALKNILKIDPKTLRPIEKEEMPIIPAPSAPNLLTNPFIPNNNHFLFSDPLLLHPNAGNYSNLGKSDKHNNNNNNSSNHNNNTASAASASSPSSAFSNNSSSSGTNNSNNNSNGKPSGSSRPPIQNGTFPPLCFPAPDFCSNFFPYQSNFPKPSTFYPGNDKIDPLIRASRLSPFANISGFNVAGFHASLPPSISLLLKHQPPRHHFKKSNQVPEKRVHKDESTKETNRNCDDISLRVGNDERGREGSAAGGESSKAGAETGVPLPVEGDGGGRKKEAESGKEEEKKTTTSTEEAEEKKKEKEDKEKDGKGQSQAAQGSQEEEEQQQQKKTEGASVGGAANKDSNNDNRKEKETEEEGAAECGKAKEERSTCQDETSACNAEAKPETTDNNDNKSVNDKER